MGKASHHPTGGGKLTQQHMEGVTDINKIMEKHLRTGVLGSGKSNGREPRFIGLTGETYHEMLIRLQEVQGAFAALPARVRKRFAHNPEQLLKFLEDQNNLREAVALGLVDEASLTPEQKQQMNLVQLSEEEERRQYEVWRANQRAARHEFPPPAEQGEDEDASFMPGRSDPESNPRNSRKKRTS